MSELIRLGHGGGGRLTDELIRDIFLEAWGNPYLNKLDDSARLKLNQTNIAFTTDSYVVTPVFFNGGDIGKLAVCGTVNDLSVMGAKPLWISVGIILEEGFSIPNLKKIVASMKLASEEAGISIVTGDTKVVSKSDGIFINTSGIGEIIWSHPGVEKIEPGDRIIINGTLGDHSAAVLSARGQFELHTDIPSDAAPLNDLIFSLENWKDHIKFMRDITRGGLGGVLSEITEKSDWGIKVFEKEVPVLDAVRGLTELLGYDPLLMANEGKAAFIVSEEAAEAICHKLKTHPYGKNSAIIGTVTKEYPGKVLLETEFGGTRILEKPLGEDLPRIC